MRLALYFENQLGTKERIPREPIIHRYGFTQGSPLSPLLCAYTIGLSAISNLKGLIMFADDGLVITEDYIDLEAEFNKPKSDDEDY